MRTSAPGATPLTPILAKRGLLITPVFLVENLLKTPLAPTDPGTHFSIYTRGHSLDQPLPCIEVRRISPRGTPRPKTPPPVDNACAPANQASKLSDL